jgi:hypothetical protein
MHNLLRLSRPGTPRNTKLVPVVLVLLEEFDEYQKSIVYRLISVCRELVLIVEPSVFPCVEAAFDLRDISQIS